MIEASQNIHSEEVEEPFATEYLAWTRGWQDWYLISAFNKLQEVEPPEEVVPQPAVKHGRPVDTLAVGWQSGSGKKRTQERRRRGERRRERERERERKKEIDR